MGQSRKEALRKVTPLARRIEEHLTKLAGDPTHPASSHWRHEVRNWISQVREAMPDLGKKTAREWSVRVADWTRRIGG
jgi:hypothetical protein